MEGHPQRTTCESRLFVDAIVSSRSLSTLLLPQFVPLVARILDTIDHNNNAHPSRLATKPALLHIYCICPSISQPGRRRGRHGPV